MTTMTMNDEPGLSAGADAPAPRRGVARWVTGVAVVVVVVAAASLALERWRPASVFPVRTVRFEGDLAHVPESDLRSAVADHLGGGLLLVDLGSVRRAVKALPWVEDAAVWRVWPQGLRISVSEREPVAVWGDDALVTATGHVFRPDARPDGLPRLGGPDGSQKEVLQRFRSWRERLGAIGLALRALRQDERRAWHGRLADGTSLALGRNDVDTRIARLINAWPRVRRAAGDRGIAALDLRYPNGFAVRWAPESEQAGKDTHP
ncbi:cell division protein FtsQ/DivIB [Arhodomonas sp. AD133]|uniref:cell division protein FtsQ/DivIB n=1 Tax=Arhodomonas sp. AD133 TaxID=3415009 RepID=UPI003EBC2009